MKKMIALFMAFAMIFALGACCIVHEYGPATCSAPATCVKCGATQGETLPHSWIPADCILPQLCTVCGARSGSPLGHSFTDADCTNPQICTVCGAQGEPALGHSATGMLEDGIDFINAKLMLHSECTVCGIELESSEKPLTSFLNGNVFMFTVSEFCSRFEKLFAENSTLELSCKLQEGDAGTAELVVTNKNGYVLAHVCFYDSEENIIRFAQADETRVAGIKLMVLMQENIAASTINFLFVEIADILSKTADNTLTSGTSFRDAIANNVFAEKEGESTDLFGVYYSCSYGEEMLSLNITIK